MEEGAVIGLVLLKFERADIPLDNAGLFICCLCTAAAAAAANGLIDIEEVGGG